MKRPRQSLDCLCDGTRSYCPDCLISFAVLMRREHPDSLSVGMLKRHLQGISGREAALLLEVTRRIAG
ncbi:MAG: hypothetical protein HW375_27 [Anaerolineales bacterium]|nr:hypothetical protein [Anaerolineales bacterium]